MIVFRLTRTACLLFLLAVTVASLGCRCPSCCCPPSPQVAPCAYEACVAELDPPELVTLVEQASLEVGTQSGPPPCLLPGDDDQFDLLRERECQCNAATNATIAHLIELERHWAGVLISCETDTVRKPLCLSRDLLSIQETDVRNTAAGSALSAYYSLAAVEAQDSYLERGITEAQMTIDRLDRLEERGLPLPEEIERSDISVQLQAIADKRLQLGLARIQLNGQLKRLLGCPVDESRLFWPQLDWTPDLAEPDVEAIVAEGLAHRADLRSIRLTACRLETVTLPVARAVLQVADGKLGTIEPQSGIVHLLRCGECKKQELPIRCRQFRRLYADTTDLAIAKIKSAAYKFIVQQQRVRLAQAGVKERRTDLDRLQKRRDVDDVAVFEISLARGRLFTAEAELIQQIGELKVAEAAIREAQGLLAYECGFSPTVCNEFCCTGNCCLSGSGCCTSVDCCSTACN